jgi:hypothetical protein
MPGLTTDSYDFNDPSSWQHGFGQSNNNLVCEVCRSLVRKSPGDAQAHRDWHAQLGG